MYKSASNSFYVIQFNTYAPTLVCVREYFVHVCIGVCIFAFYD